MAAKHYGPTTTTRTLGGFTIALLLIIVTAVTTPLSATERTTTVTGYAAEPSGVTQTSSVVVRAHGAQGTENMELRINGRTVAAWDGVGTEPRDFVHRVDTTVTISDLKVFFTNDGGWPEADRNLHVEHVVVDGTVFASDAPTTLSRGSWNRGSACAEGFKRSGWLHCGTAFFEYQAASGLLLQGTTETSKPDGRVSSSIVVVARGAQGTENMELRLNGQPATSWTDVDTDIGRFEHVVTDPTTIETVEVRFTNDGGWPDADRNLFVDRIEIDGVAYESEAATTWSIGSWTGANGCAEGHKKSEWLHCPNARFDYRAAAGTELARSQPEVEEPDLGQPVGGDDTGADQDPENEIPGQSTIVVRAAGAQGDEAMELRVNGEFVAAWSDIGTEAGDHVHLVDRDVVLDRVDVVFTNDGGWPDADRNLFVDHVTVDGQTFQSESDTTRSVGSWSRTSGCDGGTKRTEWLHCPNAAFTYTDAAGLHLTAGSGQTSPPHEADRPHLLVMTKASVFSHPSITAGRAMVAELATANDFDVTFTENSAVFQDPATVETFDAVVFLNTDSVVFDTPEEKQAFQDYIDAGRGFVGVHGASATHWRHDPWDWYRDLVGARFVDHPTGGPQTATVSVTDSEHESTTHLPSHWSVVDEWYNFDAHPTDVNVLLTVDEETYVGGTMGDAHPIAWNHRFGPADAPVWYTNLGHDPSLYQDSLFRDHVLGGIRWVLTVST